MRDSVPIRPVRIVRLTCFFRSNPLPLPQSPVFPLPIIAFLSLSILRARARSPFLYDRPDPISLSLFLTHSISPFPPPRACVRVGACGSAVELVNGRTRTHSPLLASAARSFSVRALRGHREVLVSKPIERLRGTRSLRQREKARERKTGRIDKEIRREEERVGFNGEGREERNADGGGKLEDKEEERQKRKGGKTSRRRRRVNKCARERVEGIRGERERRAIVLSKRIAGEGASISRASLASASR